VTTDPSGEAERDETAPAEARPQRDDAESEHADRVGDAPKATPDAGDAGDGGDPTPGGGRPRRRRRGLLVGAIVVVAIVAGGVAVAVAGGGDGDTAAEPPPSTAPPTTAPPTTAPAARGPATIATSQVAEIQAFDAPSEDAGVVATLADVTEYGAPRTFLVTAREGDWLDVLLPVRPNGTHGWIRAADVSLATTTYSITVDLDAHRVTLRDGADVIVETDAVIGSPETPTPVGTFYVTDPVDLRSEPDGTYGAFALGLSGYSEVLYEFAGGPGQLALHGTNRPEQVGQDISNGCVRIANEEIMRIAERLPLGTPVEIVA
jgi:lipoprotein-anchoring transpeptidase ErfK/SrfK